MTTRARGFAFFIDRIYRLLWNNMGELCDACYALFGKLICLMICCVIICYVIDMLEIIIIIMTVTIHAMICARYELICLKAWETYVIWMICDINGLLWLTCEMTSQHEIQPDLHMRIMINVMRNIMKNGMKTIWYEWDASEIVLMIIKMEKY